MNNRAAGFSGSGKRVIVFVLGVLVLAELGFLLRARVFPATMNFRKYADRILAECAGVAYRPGCYDEKIPKLMKTISMEDAFAVTRLVQEKDPQYLYCHVLGHKVAWNEVAKDVSKWKDVVARCPATFCNNGCQHGALMRRFDSEHLTDVQIQEAKPDLADVCEPRGTWKPTEVERSMCYHGLGHLTMYMTNADIPKSIALCGELARKPDGRDYYQTCTQGVFMQIFQPLEPDDFALIKGIAPAKDSIAAFCDRFSGESWFSCHGESWPLFTKEIHTPKGLMDFCSYTTDPKGLEKCVATGINFLTVELVVDQDRKTEAMSAYCTGLPAPYNGQCFGDAAFRLVQMDPRYGETAVRVCKASEAFGLAGVCYPYLVLHSTHSFHPGSPEQTAYCRLLPAPWSETCKQQK